MAPALVFMVLIVVAFTTWRYSVWRWPVRRCPSCKGTGRNSGSNKLRWGTCRRCGGKGELPRSAARRR